MSKRRRLLDEEAFDFSRKSGSKKDYPLSEGPEHPIMASRTEDTEFLEEAHEALSKLVNKTTKRAQHPRGLRRNDAWH